MRHRARPARCRSSSDRQLPMLTVKEGDIKWYRNDRCEFDQDAVIKVIGVGGGGGNAVDHMISARRAGRGVHLRQHRRAGAAAASQRAQTRSSSATSPRAWAPAPSPKPAARPRWKTRERIARADRRRAHAVHHRRHGRRHRHRRGAGDRARSPRSMGILTVGVVTKPFDFEGAAAHEDRRRRASTSSKPHVDSLIVILNDKLIEVLGDDVTQDEAFARGQRRAEQRGRRHRRDHQRARAWSTSTSRTCRR